MRHRRTQADRREQASERILDAAEELFARRGYHGVTLREVATCASSDSALLHYYFGSKAGLFDAVIERRAELVNQVRLDSLNQYEREQGDAMTVEGVVQAYLSPTFELMMRGDPGLLNYGAIIAKVNATTSGEEHSLAVLPFDQVVKTMIGMLSRARPDCAEADLFWFYHLLSGAITLSLAQTGRIDALSGGLCRSSDFETILDRMIRVFGRGLDAVGSGLSPKRAPGVRRAVAPRRRTKRAAK